MIGAAIAFLAGAVGLQQQASLPPPGWGALALLWPALLWLARRHRAWQSGRYLGWLACGFAWALGHAWLTQPRDLPPALEGEILQVEASIATIPTRRDVVTRFEVTLHNARHAEQAVTTLPRRLRLSWWHAPAELAVGSTWRFAVKLKRPHGLMNPGGFDYEAWLYQQGLGATGYVRAEPAPVLLQANSGQHGLHRLRQSLANHLAAALPESDNLGVIQAIAVGWRANIPPERWELLRDTGTNHLVAISGLHIGLLAGFAFALVNWSWRRLPGLPLYWPAPRAAAAAAIAAAGGYAALAGFALPTQRALIMLAVFMGAVLAGRQLRVGHGLGLALLGILLWQPTAVLLPGFWLSFGAVAAILFALLGRLRRLPVVLGWVRVQWAVTLGLLPLLLWQFQQCALIAPLANLLAVPWFSFGIVPPTLVALGLVSFWPAAAGMLLALVDYQLSWLWQLLTPLAELPGAQWQQGSPPGWTLGLALLAAALLLAPAGLPGRWLAPLLLLPLWRTPPTPPPGQFEVTQLDVGQGNATVVVTHAHTLVYDTGPKYSEQFDTGAAVVVPYLRQRGIAHIDRLVISHSDNDHIGGTASVLAALPVGEVLSSTPAAITHPQRRACQRGQQWRWDGVQFQMLHPAPATWLTGNDRSCVLRITAPGGSVLLTGDIEAVAEAQLTRLFGTALASDVLQIPHHGSNSSSSRRFLTAVDPSWALVGAGYRNQWEFPREAILARYTARDVRVLDTICSGAITLTVGADGITITEQHRLGARRYWHHQCGEEKLRAE